MSAIEVQVSASHIADASDAHDASAISFSPAGTIVATDVQAAIAEVASEALSVEDESLIVSMEVNA